ncbi:MAG: hypothetical protein ABI893_13455 [Polaromonas sp.]|uniref:hypothetical protein n=1 Tax=Polaromonas sp. TaxID=1869339 RepID=UPI003265836E
MNTPFSRHASAPALLADAMRLKGRLTPPPPAAPPRNVVASGAYPPAAAHVPG